MVSFFNSSSSLQDPITESKSKSKSKSVQVKRRRCKNHRDDVIIANLPEEIMHEILIKLPIKSLLRFRSVSKEWNSRVRSRFFTSMHCKHQQEDNSNLRLMLHDISTSCYMVNCNSMDKATITNPGFDLEDLFYIHGSCRGLLLVVVRNLIMYLWNPTTKEYRELPPVTRTPRGIIATCGFGYDQLTDDFKVLSCIRRYTETKNCTEVDFIDKVYLYTGQSNSWKKLSNIQYELDELCVGVKERLYCAATRRLSSDHNGTMFLSCFDIGSEKFDELPLPNNNDDDGVYRSCYVTSLRGNLCVITKSGAERIIWVLDDNGVKESWRKEATYFGQGSPSTICFPKIDGKIVMHVYKGILIAPNTLGHEANIVTYDTRNKRCKIHKIDGAPSWFRSITYVETLVSPNAVGGN